MYYMQVLDDDDDLDELELRRIALASAAQNMMRAEESDPTIADTPASPSPSPEPIVESESEAIEIPLQLEEKIGALADKSDPNKKRKEQQRSLSMLLCLHRFFKNVHKTMSNFLLGFQGQLASFTTTFK